MKTIAIDFDGVIHAYSQGWQGGEIYDNPVNQAFFAIDQMFQAGFNVFILSTRNSRQIKKWLKEQTYESEYLHDGPGNDPQLYLYPKFAFTVEVIPFWVKFWKKKNMLGVTNRKLPATVYIDDRALRFDGDWNSTLLQISNFKTYQEINGVPK